MSRDIPVCRRAVVGICIGLVLLLPPSLRAGSAFTYQGQLTLHGNPVNGTCSMQFRLFNQSTGGSLLDTIGPQDVAVSGGVFTALLDFGAEKLGSGDRWLEISVDCGTGLIQLNPRQAITATPYAIFSNSVATNTITTSHIVDGAVGSSKLADGGITSEKIAAGAVTGAQLAPASVDGAKLASNSVDSSKIADGTITAADIDSKSVQRRIDALCGIDAAIRSISESGGVACIAAGGDITDVNAGAGLAGGGTTGAVSLAAAFAGSGVANTVSRSDHNHSGAYWASSQPGMESGVLKVANTYATNGNGLFATAFGSNGTGVWGRANLGTSAWGIRGESREGSGVRATTTSGVALRASTGVGQGYAGYFDGRVHVAGTLTKSAGSFKIDHPVDPANQYLSHSFVESWERMNIYDGVVKLDAAGEARVTLPHWFEELNRDFRYQLTPIGAFAPLYIAEELVENGFRIAGGSPGLRVSWQLTGTRKDAYATHHPFKVEEEKPEHEKGRYLNPVEHGQPETLGVGFDAK